VKIKKDDPLAFFLVYKIKLQKMFNVSRSISPQITAQYNMLWMKFKHFNNFHLFIYSKNEETTFKKRKKNRRSTKNIPRRIKIFQVFNFNVKNLLLLYVGIHLIFLSFFLYFYGYKRPNQNPKQNHKGKTAFLFKNNYSSLYIIAIRLEQSGQSDTRPKSFKEFCINFSSFRSFIIASH
jgi:hypothetical protein